MSETFNLKIIARKAKSDSNESHLFIRINLNQKRKEIGLKIKVENSKWNLKTQSLRGTTEQVRIINHQLEQIRSKFIKIHSDLKFQKGSYSIDELIQLYEGKGPSNMDYTILKMFKIHNDKVKELIGIDYAKATYQRFMTTKLHVEDFLKTKKKNDILIRDMNNGFLKDFDHYLKTKKNINHNSSVKYIRIVMSIARLGIEYGWIDKDPFFGFKQHLQEVKRGFLSDEELNLLETTDIPNERIAVIRDMFVFCCYTGLAYSDVSQLTNDKIVKYKDGEYWLNLYRQKTDVKSNVPLLPKAIEIIDKYKDHPECDVTGKVLPIRSNAKFNAYLKEVADLCGITRNLTTHLARHTFATTVTLNNDVPIESVSSMLGHKNIKTTQIYAKVIDKKVGSDMKKLKEKLNGNKP